MKRAIAALLSTAILAAGSVCAVFAETTAPSGAALQAVSAASNTLEMKMSYGDYKLVTVNIKTSELVTGLLIETDCSKTQIFPYAEKSVILPDAEGAKPNLVISEDRISLLFSPDGFDCSKGVDVADIAFVSYGYANETSGSVTLNIVELYNKSMKEIDHSAVTFTVKDPPDSETDTAPETPVISDTDKTTDTTPVTPIVSDTDKTTDTTPVTPTVSDTDTTPVTPTVSDTDTTTDTTPVTPTVSDTDKTTDTTPVTPIVSDTDKTTDTTHVTPTVSDTDKTTDTTPVTPTVSDTDKTTDTTPVTPTVTDTDKTTDTTPVTPTVTDTDKTTDTTPVPPTVTDTDKTTDTIPEIPDITTTDTDTSADTDSEPPAQKPDRIYGDVDGDGKLTSDDALKILRFTVSLQKFTDEQITIADVDASGDVTSSDALEILRRSVGLSTKTRAGTKVLWT